MNSQECPWFRAGCTMEDTLWHDYKWLCLCSLKPTLILNGYDIRGNPCSTAFFNFYLSYFAPNTMNKALKIYEANWFCNRSRNVQWRSVDVSFQQPLNQWRSLTRNFVLIYLHLKCGRGGVVYLFQYWEEGIGETVVAAFKRGDGLLKLMRSGWITGLIAF